MHGHARIPTRIYAHPRISVHINAHTLVRTRAHAHVETDIDVLDCRVVKGVMEVPQAGHG
eukprot:15213651-Alexandrium_andersonii.AAC.1